MWYHKVSLFLFLFSVLLGCDNSGHIDNNNQEREQSGLLISSLSKINHLDNTKNISDDIYVSFNEQKLAKLSPSSSLHIIPHIASDKGKDFSCH
jgi:hypothetical protein